MAESDNILDKLNAIADTFAEACAVRYAQMIIDDINRQLTIPEAKDRKPLIYIKMIERFQQELDALSGEVKISDE